MHDGEALGVKLVASTEAYAHPEYERRLTAAQIVIEMMDGARDRIARELGAPGT